MAKKIGEQLLSRDIEKFKSDLEKESFRFRTKFEKLHGDRAEVIKNLYTKIVDTEENLSSLMSPFQPAGTDPQEVKAKKSADSINDLISYFERNKIFLDEKTEKSISKIVEICRSAWYDFDLVRMLKEDQDKTYHKQWNEAWNKFKDQSPKTKHKVIQSFRQILGIEDGR